VRRALGDALISTVAVVVLLVALVSIDDRVRLQLGEMLSAPASANVKGVSTDLGEMAGVVLFALRDQGLEHATLVIFVLAATVLVLFMVRT
jgi:hypothetical protein